MKKLLFYVSLMSFWCVTASAMQNNPYHLGADATSADLIRVTSAIRTELDAIWQLILAGNIAQATQRLNDPLLVQAITNNPSFRWRYNQFLNRVNPNRIQQPGGARVLFPTNQRPRPSC